MLRAQGHRIRITRLERAFGDPARGATRSGPASAAGGARRRRRQGRLTCSRPAVSAPVTSWSRNRASRVSGIPATENRAADIDWS